MLPRHDAIDLPPLLTPYATMPRYAAMLPLMPLRRRRRHATLADIDASPLRYAADAPPCRCHCR